MSLLTEGQHGLKAHSDGPVPVQTRSERFSSTDPAEFPEVTGLELEWKLTPVALLRPLIDGALDGSPYGAEGAGIEWVDRSDARVGSAGKPEERASANAWASFERALAVTVGSEEHSEVAIERTGLGAEPRAAHTIITATPNSRGTVILRSSGPATLSENVEIVVGDGADLTVVSLQEWDGEALHLASHFATVGRDARLKHVVVSLGGA
ncbi:MAG: SufD family Fe-S cluster assembly protein, partial [Rhodoglobus sp.]